MERTLQDFFIQWEKCLLPPVMGILPPSTNVCKAKQESKKFLILFEWKWWRTRKLGLTLDWMANPSNTYLIVTPSNLFVHLHTCKHPIHSSQTSHLICITCIIIPTSQWEKQHSMYINDHKHSIYIHEHKEWRKKNHDLLLKNSLKLLQNAVTVTDSL